MNLLPYFLFIENCSTKALEVIGHKHHIIPRHIFNQKDPMILENFKLYLPIKYANDPNNIISLSIEDHYAAHSLLAEIYEGYNKRIYISNKIACGLIAFELNLTEQEREDRIYELSLAMRSLQKKLKKTIRKKRKSPCVESIERRIEWWKEYKNTAAYKFRIENIRNAHLGKKRTFSKEWYEKHKINSEKNKDYRHTPEAKEKIRLARLGKPVSAECIANRKKYWKDNPDKLKEKSDKSVATRKQNGTYVHTEETKQRISDIEKAFIAAGGIKAKHYPCSISGKIYQALRYACKEYGIGYQTLKFRLGSELEEWKSWYYVDKDGIKK